MASKCPERSNLCTWLEKLHTQKEELVKVGVKIEDKDFCSVIISSLPGYLSKFAVTLLANVQLYLMIKTINPDVFISLINEEYHHRAALRDKPSVNAQHRPGRTTDEALTMAPGPPPHLRGNNQ